MKPRKPVAPKVKKPAAKPVAAPKPKKTMPPAGPSFFNQAGKPDPNGDYDKHGYMVRVPGKRNSFTKQPPKERERTPEEIAAARRAGFSR